MFGSKCNVTSYEESSDDLTKCTICAQTFQEPKILSCIHTFCKTCLQAYILKFKKSDCEEVPCPTCKKEFLVPDGGLDRLPSNCFMEGLIHMKSNCIKPSSIGVVCDSCREDSSLDETELPNAEVYCKDCEQKLCTECRRYHLKSKLSKHHTVINLESKQNNVEYSVNKSIPEMCSIHGMKPIDIFCLTCSETVCSMCFIGNHKSHNGSSVVAVMNDFQKSINDDMHNLSELIPQLYQKRTKLEEDGAKFIDQFNELEIEIIQDREDLKGLLEVHCQSLLTHLKVQQESNIKSMETCVDDIDFLLTSVENFKTYCNQLLNIGTSRTICEAMGLLKDRSTELQRKCQSELENGFEFRNIWLRHTITQETLDSYGVNLIGKLEELPVTEPETSSFDSGDECSTSDGTVNGDEKFAPKESVTDLLENLSKTKENNSWLRDRIEELEGSERELTDKVKDLEKEIAYLRGSEGAGSCLKEKEKRFESKTDTIDFESGDHAFSLSKGSINYKNGAKSLIKFNSISKSSPVWNVEALAILKNEFFIVVKTPNITVEIYDLASLSFKRRWTNKRLYVVPDMKSSEDGNCLFLLNVTIKEMSNEIIRFDPYGVLLTYWSVESSFGLLSVSQDSTVLFTSWNKNEITEYRCDGQKVRVIPLSWNYGFSHPCHAIRLNSDNILVSHGAGRDPMQRICIIDAYGKVLACKAKFSNPAYMDTDRFNNIVVVDRGHSLVKVLDSNLVVIAGKFYCSNTETCATTPQKAIIDESNERVFVVERPKTKRFKSPSEKTCQDVVTILSITKE